MTALRRLINTIRLSVPIDSLRARLRRWKVIREWRRQGCPTPPPPELKQATIREYARRFRMSLLIETGTLFGDTVAATKEYFSEVYSIELSPELHMGAKKRFTNDARVHLLLGDSGDVLKELLPGITRPPLFWLDAHYSGGRTARGSTDTPIVEELETILAACRDCVVLIDDARLFDGTNSYPTLGEIKKRLEENNPRWVVEVKDDIIRICR